MSFWQADALLVMPSAHSGARLVMQVSTAAALRPVLVAHTLIRQFNMLTSRPLCMQIDYMSEDDARWIFQQLIIAVDYCHRLGIANRDIKVRACACSIKHKLWPNSEHSCMQPPTACRHVCMRPSRLLVELAQTSWCCMQSVCVKLG